MTTRAALQSLVAQYESETFELKRSTAELRRAGETLWVFSNGEGGEVMIGVGPDGGTASRTQCSRRPRGAVTVTFKAEVVAGVRDLVPGGHQVGTKYVPSSSA